MQSKGTQNAQLQGPQATTNPDVAASWWSTYASGGDGMEGISRF
jgi:hypothetical protein